MAADKSLHHSQDADSPEFTVESRAEGSTTVIALGGRLYGNLSASVRDRVLCGVEPGQSFVMDFSAVEDISGSAFRRLLLFARYVRGLGGTVVVRGASDRLRAIADASGFSDLARDAAPVAIPSNPKGLRIRTDCYPTHTCNGFDVRPGNPLPLGAIALPHGVNFAVYSRHATQCSLVLFEPGAAAPFAEIPFPHGFRVGDVHTMTVFHLDPEEIEYGYRVDGPFEPREGHRFKREYVLLDPAARAISWRPVWGHEAESLGTPRAGLLAEDFDWEDDRPLGLPPSWHGTQAWRADWSGTSRVIAFQARLRGVSPGDVIYAAFNMYWETLPFELPSLEDGRTWRLFANTGVEAPADVFFPGTGPLRENAEKALVGGRSVLILVAR